MKARTVKRQRLDRIGPLVVAVGLLVGLMQLTGCSGKATYPVVGKVTVKGQSDAKALAGYVVSFESTDKPISASGEVQPDGTFWVTTYEERDGAVPGKHRIAVTPPAPEIDQPRLPSQISQRYADFKTSGLETEIKAGANDVVLELDPAKH